MLRILAPLGDHQHSTRVVLGHAAAGAGATTIRQSVDYAPFGEVTAVHDANGLSTTAALDVAFAHHGSLQDADTGLQLKGARWYSPDLGRFLSVDPAHDGTNWYAFAGNDPVNMSDPTGLSQAGHPLGRSTLAGPSIGGASLLAGLGATNARPRSSIDVIASTLGSRPAAPATRGITLAASRAVVQALNGPSPGVVRELQGLQRTQAYYEDQARWNAAQTVLAKATAGWKPQDTYTIGPVDRFVDDFQLGLDAVGLIPGVGEIADVANGLISLGRGDYTGAGLSFASMIPIVGDAFGKGGKAARAASNAAELARQIDIVKAGRAAEVAQNAANGGRLGSVTTRQQVAAIAAELESRGYQVTGGGRLPEMYIPGPNRARKGSAYPDVTADVGGRTIHINTIDTLVDGATPTAREARNAVKIRSLVPDQHLILVPKRKP